MTAQACAVHGVSQRRGCRALAVDRSSVRDKPTRPDDADLRVAMKAVAAERRRFGYRRIHMMLVRQGIVMNLKKLRRLYREEKLQVRRRGGRKRALGTRRPMVQPSAANERWSLDFISDAFTDGRRFRVLAVVDDFACECLALVADTSLSGARVARELDVLIARRGRPGTIVSDNGTELTSTAILSWSQRTSVGWHYIAPGKPMSERLYRELQRPVPRRIPKRSAVLDLGRGPLADPSLEGRLQSSQTAFSAREHPARRICHEDQAGNAGRMSPTINPRILR